MANQWVSPNTITGDAASGQRYLRRDHINEYFWREVAKGNHILFVAPRRVGKSSIMQDLADNPMENHACIYQNIEAVKTKDEFYNRLFDLILQCASKTSKAKIFVANCLAKYGIEEITKSGLKLKRNDIDYEKELRNLIPELKNTQINTVIFLDEFAEVINKLNKQGKQQDAIDILHTLRELRSNSDFKHFTLVYAGSIGLEFVINTIDRPKLINDLHRIKTEALTRGEADQLIAQITKGATIQLSQEIIDHLKIKINHLLPYYIQLMIEQIDLIGRRTNQSEITSVIIDDAFEQVILENKNFDDWLIRLKDYHKDFFPFINEILKYTAKYDTITIQEIYNKANDPQYKREDDYMDFVEQLLYDGYLVETDKHVYRFISPFLQKFWLRKFPVYNG
ncbi:hypothetical protein [Mucilaginibacter sp.]|uniref:hypothetical protein n=1 Tax=Mucilaginibacter sp. TaxID=1882438 RepID=UPI00283E4649|nr:hypothetical protein [Mucilaginibacter sp.]MDR3697669.1 hypothetical protein [Mucilaginibacter sp.]